MNPSTVRKPGPQVINAPPNGSHKVSVTPLARGLLQRDILAQCNLYFSPQDPEEIGRNGMRV